jgi:hypothetical protein
MWLVKFQWANVRAGSTRPPGYAPTQGTTMVASGEFTAFGHREGFDCYLFINGADAENFKKHVEGPKGPKNLKGLQIHLIEVTPEDVAHLDLDPVRRKNRAAAPQI